MAVIRRWLQHLPVCSSEGRQSPENRLFTKDLAGSWAELPLAHGTGTTSYTWARADSAAERVTEVLGAGVSAPTLHPTNLERHQLLKLLSKKRKELLNFVNVFVFTVSLSQCHYFCCRDWIKSLQLIEICSLQPSLSFEHSSTSPRSLSCHWDPFCKGK